MGKALVGMKSIMVFDPKHSKKETKRRFANWCKHNHQSAIADKHVPTVEETRRMLAQYR